MSLNLKIAVLILVLVLLNIYVLSSVKNYPIEYNREVEVVASTYYHIKKDCPNKNGLEALRANYLLSIKSPAQREWVYNNFSDIFYQYCYIYKKV